MDDPPDWDKAEAPNGETYYQNSVTEQVMWQHPHDYTYQQKYLEYKAKSKLGFSDAAPATYKVVMDGTTMKHVKLTQEEGFQSYTPPPEEPASKKGAGGRRNSLVAQEKRKSVLDKRKSVSG